MPRAQRRRALVLVGLMLLGMILETLGVWLVLPAVALMAHDDSPSRFPAFGRLLVWLGNPSRERVIVVSMLILVAVSVIRAGYLAFVSWSQMRFVYGVQIQISERLFAGYLGQPYEFHLARNSAELIRNALGDVDVVTQHGILQTLNLTAEVLVLLGIFALLLYIEPVGALVSIGSLMVAGWAFAHLARNRITRWSEQRLRHEGLRLQHLQQGLGAVKEMKLLGREADFVQQYALHTRASSHATERNQLMQQLPRLALEMLAMIALAALVVVMIIQHRPLQALIPTIGVFAAAAFRIMPSANRIIMAIHAMRFADPVLTSLSQEIASFRAPVRQVSDTALPFERTVRVNIIEFRYPGTTIAALRDIDLTISAGSTLGFIGGSGAGKSTLIDVILGLLSPQRGEVLVDGVNIASNCRGWQRNIGYVPQQIYLTDDTLKRNIAFGLPDSEVDDASVKRALRAAQLEQFVAELPEGLNTRVGERGVRLSGGQLQRIGIARALYHDPPVLVLDEATSSLDVATERGVMQAVRALQNKTVIVVAHRLSTVEHCERLYRLEAGRIVEVRESIGTVVTGAR